MRENTNELIVALEALQDRVDSKLTYISWVEGEMEALQKERDQAYARVRELDTRIEHAMAVLRDADFQIEFRNYPETEEVKENINIEELQKQNEAFRAFHASDLKHILELNKEIKCLKDQLSQNSKKQ
jgi:hypothetical protein